MVGFGSMMVEQWMTAMQPSPRRYDGFHACAGRIVQTTVGRADFDQGDAMHGGVT
jgi:hypothetical protein